MRNVIRSLAVLVLALGVAIPSPAAAQGVSSDADLAGLTLVRPSTLHDLLSEDTIYTLLRLRTEEPPLAVSLNEPFSSATTAYTADVRDHVRQVLVTPALSDSNATVTVNGSDPATPVSLSSGENVIDIVVTEQDGLTSKSYAVTVTRTDRPLLKGDLTGLTVTDENGSPVHLVPSARHVPHFALHQVPGFYSWISSYSLWVPSDVSSVTVTPTWDAGSDYWIEVRAATDFEHPTRHNRLTTTRVNASGETSTAITLAENLRQRTEIWLGVHVDGGVHLYFLNVLRGTGLEGFCYGRQGTHSLCPAEPDVPEQKEDQQHGASTQGPSGAIANPQETQDGAESDDSETPPGPVQNLELTAKGKRVVVSWSAPAGGGAPSGYQVKLEDSSGGKAKVRRPGAKKLRIVYRDLEPGTTYQVSVRARNEWGESAWSTSQITLD